MHHESNSTDAASDLRGLGTYPLFPYVGIILEIAIYPYANDCCFQAVHERPYTLPIRYSNMFSTYVRCFMTHFTHIFKIDFIAHKNAQGMEENGLHLQCLHNAFQNCVKYVQIDCILHLSKILMAHKMYV